MGATPWLSGNALGFRATGLRSSKLTSLPDELLVVITQNLHAIDLLQIACVCRDLRAPAEHEQVWHALIVRHLQPVIAAFFDDRCPPPQTGLSWKQHYFDFRLRWKQMAQERSGRLLIQVLENGVV